ncbi:BTAD domain-containing putative transcriptional regulator [Streptomyces mobaraensis]|uniref:AfsR/SARP family transcriptional regulator n=1 Tax=Streptomyces mobaraensis TaxID=35621 RepID=UPI00332C18E7
MRFLLLGPLEICRSSAPVDLGGPRQRAVLATLAMRANETVTPYYLTEAIWETPPASPKSNLRTYVSGLRQRLGDEDGRRLITRPDGYVLRTEKGESDLEEFEQLASRGEKALRAGAVREAARFFRQALGLWRGDPFEGLSMGRHLRAESERLTERRLAVIGQHTRALIDLGQYDVISDLRRLVSEEPLREEFHGQLMLALSRSGRPAEALQVFQDARRLLVDQLGTEPGATLQQLHHQILTMAPEVAAGAGRLEISTVPPAPPSQLPAPPRPFVGRESEVGKVSLALRGTGKSTVTMVISGAAGVGKSWLALHWAHLSAHEFPDGRLYADLQAFGPAPGPLAPEVALRGFLSALGVRPTAIPPDLEGQSALFRTLLTGKRILVVLDNARDSEQVLPLLPGSPGSAAVVTSRHRLCGLIARHGASSLHLGTFGHEDAFRLFVGRLGSPWVGRHHRAVTEISRLCAGLPLALSLVATRAAALPEDHLPSLLRELRLPASRLDALSTGETHADVRTVLSWSLRSVSAEGARLFTLLGLSPCPDISLPAAASLGDHPLRQARAVLRELEDVHLVRQHQPGRYVMPDLVRLHATEEAARHHPSELGAAPLRRLLDFYRRTASLGARILDPEHVGATTDRSAGGGAPLTMSRASDARAWFVSERPCLLSMMRLATTMGWHAEVRELSSALRMLIPNRGAPTAASDPASTLQTDKSGWAEFAGGTHPTHLTGGPSPADGLGDGSGADFVRAATGAPQ